MKLLSHGRCAFGAGFAGLSSAWLWALLAPPLVAAPAQAAVPQKSQTASREMWAIRTKDSIHLDGVLDEPAWAEAPIATDFLQRLPREGQPATERTEVRALYDATALYFGVKAFDSTPNRLITYTLAQDFNTINNDTICVYLDTFHDKRSGYSFCANPGGAKREVQFVDEGRESNVDWEDVWDVRTRTVADGWFAEFQIPFKSLRFHRREVQTWGVNVSRRVPRGKEDSLWAFLPRRYSPLIRGIALAGTLRGIEGVKPSSNFKVKPFVSATAAKFRADDHDLLARPGLDVKYGLTSYFTLDVSLNTDFSQVEVDEQQIKLTRFSLFFPEKRDFFLENAGIFAVTERRLGETPTFLPFFSRRIGLSARGRPIPILGGVRLTGRQGPFSLGWLTMQTRDVPSEPGSNFTVLRLKRNILASSEIGALVVNREGNGPANFNRTFVADGNFHFFRNLMLRSFAAVTRSPGLGDDTAGEASAEWLGNLLEARTRYLYIGDDFNAEVGFVPRTGSRMSESLLGLHPQPKGSRRIREFFPYGKLQYTTDQKNLLLTRVSELGLETDFQDGAILTFGGRFSFERLEAPHTAFPIPPGDYRFNEWLVVFQSDNARPLAGTARYERGRFWNGRRQGTQLSLIYKPTYRWDLSTRYNQERVVLPSGNFVTHLVTFRVAYAFDTRQFLSALLQYNSTLRQLSSNLRYNLIHRPLSDIFVVYNEERDVFNKGQVDWSLAFKYTHMLDLF
ncbi:MAG: carbohydrate binding family 9 domain-containing protein [Acidobacteria bacterium]|nr:carbohydrate binding family 9 domain-containing protein [Acidobacteriota bacterium]